MAGVTMKFCFFVLSSVLVLLSFSAKTQEVAVVQLYTQDELLDLIKQNAHSRGRNPS